MVETTLREKTDADRKKRIIYYGQELDKTAKRKPSDSSKVVSAGSVRSSAADDEGNASKGTNAQDTGRIEGVQDTGTGSEEMKYPEGDDSAGSADSISGDNAEASGNGNKDIINTDKIANDSIDAADSSSEGDASSAYDRIVIYKDEPDDACSRSDGRTAVIAGLAVVLGIAALKIIKKAVKKCFL